MIASEDETDGAFWTEAKGELDEIKFGDYKSNEFESTKGRFFYNGFGK